MVGLRPRIPGSRHLCVAMIPPLRTSALLVPDPMPWLEPVSNPMSAAMPGKIIRLRSGLEVVCYPGAPTRRDAGVFGSRSRSSNRLSDGCPSPPRPSRRDGCSLGAIGSPGWPRRASPAALPPNTAQEPHPAVRLDLPAPSQRIVSRLCQSKWTSVRGAVAARGASGVDRMQARRTDAAGTPMDRRNRTISDAESHGEPKEGVHLYPSSGASRVCENGSDGTALSCRPSRPAGGESV